MSEGSWLLRSAQAFYTTRSNTVIKNSLGMPRTVAFLQAVSQGLSLVWMGLHDSLYPAPDLCPVDAYSFFLMGVVAMPVREAGGQEAGGQPWTGSQRLRYLVGLSSGGTIKGHGACWD